MTEITTATETRGADKPLQSWKEIAAYLDRDARTARRWEKELGLPIRRHGDSSRASVYAYPSEIDAWRASNAPRATAYSDWLRGRRLAATLAMAAMVVIGVGLLFKGPILDPVNPSASAAAKASRGSMSVRLVRDDPGGGAEGTISADGRFLACNDWETGNAGICDLDSGEKKMLTQYGSWKDDNAWNSTGFADLGVISPDGTQIAFTYYTSSRLPNPTTELRIINADGSGERSLYSKSPYTDDGWLIPDAWASNGEHILGRLHLADEGYLAPDEGNYALVLISVDDGSLRTLRELRSPRRYRRRTFLSSDGRYVAYDFPPDRKVADGDVYILPIAGGEPVAVSSHPADDYVLGFMPDVGTLLFASSRSGSYGIWAVRIENGKPIAEPELIRPHVGAIKSAGLDDSGALYYTLESVPTNSYVASINPPTGTTNEVPKRVTSRFSGSNDWPATSPDGSKTAFRSWQGPGDKSGMKITVSSATTGSVHDIVPQLTSFRRLRWHSDGESFLLLGYPRDATLPGLYRVDSRTGAATLVVRESDGEIADWSADGREVYFQLKDPSRLVKRTLEGPTEQEIYRLAEGDRRFYVAGVSPDDKYVAIHRAGSANENGIVVAATTGGETRSLTIPDLKFPFRNRDDNFAWSADSKSLYVAPLHGGSIYRLSISGDAPVDTGLGRDVWSDRFSDEDWEDVHLRTLSVSPDGKELAFSVQENYEFGVWAMEDFLPKTEQ